VIEGSQARREETSEVLLDPQLNAAIDEQNEAMLQRDVAHQKAKSIAAEQSEREPGRKAAVAAGERRRQTRRETNSDFPPEVVDATSDEGLRRLREARADRAKQDLLDAAFTSHRSPGDRFGPGEISPEDGARIRQDQDKAGEESQGG
jgi:hypothetical protein